MFYQVRIPEHQRNFVRFLWWPDGNISQDLAEYEMNVHIFGAVSSPSCSNFGLRKAAADYEYKIGKESADVLQRNFYVDDCLRSDKTVDVAIKRMHSVIDACANGGFHLTKLTSNDRTVLETIPAEERTKELRSLDLDHHDLPIERALGVHWHVESDKFGFHITFKDKPPTRRGILSTIGSIYDPLGIVAPVLLPGKMILQDLCREKADWDDEISETYRHRWEEWKRSLPLLEEFDLNRHSFSDDKKMTLDRFIVLSLLAKLVVHQSSK